MFCGAPEGIDARTLADLARRPDRGPERRRGPERGPGRGPGPAVLHVARDDSRMAAIGAALRFFAPDLSVLAMPAWDCLPYDRVSPNAEIAAARVDALARLAGPPAERPRLLLTTVNAILQRVPTAQTIRDSARRHRVGAPLDLEDLFAFLTRNGFSRVGSVMEAGEFAVRGGIVDIFPPGAEAPRRLDFFGDVLESIRIFDPLSQRTTGNSEVIDLVPVSELPMARAAIERFRIAYRELFGAVSGEDPLYEAISAGRKHPGMEHWLPLFHEHLETLFDYAPDATVTRDPLCDEASETRLAQIEDYYQARRDMGAAAYAGAPIYNAIPPDRLYLAADEWRALLDRRGAILFSPFQEPEAAGVFDLGGRQGRNFAPERAQAGERQADGDVFEALKRHVDGLIGEGRRVAIAGHARGSLERLGVVLRDHGLNVGPLCETLDEAMALPARMCVLALLPLEHGFIAPGLATISEQDILGDRLTRPSRRSRRAENFLSEASQLASGDLVVHVEHGIGRYQGLSTIDVLGAPHDCLQIAYDGGDRLYVPVENVEVLSRYGDGEAAPGLDRLGGAGWQARKARLKQRIRDMAEQLIRIAAERELRQAVRIAPPAGLYDEFCARFSFDETEDQLAAIDDVAEDLESGRPMDRLICGDVGFGKTEVALRAAFATVMAGGQVAVVTPTTLLCRQHFQTFSERFAGLPIEIRQLSRLVAARDAGETRRGLETGNVDIVIGTHALLGKAIRFKSLTLLVIDEEQHFGVAHKERLKDLKSDVHVLTLTATPIPRTLQLSLSGVKDLSLIATPPLDRLAVRTFVTPHDPLVLREALLREHYRGGQSFYVCPRIQDLPEAADFLSQHVPEVKFVSAHGQMAASQLEDVMTGFYDGRFDVLLSTSIVESGLDIPRANTLIVHRADRFGLAQLYQLRGRIGRAKLRGYAYFTLPARRAVTANAEARLKVLQSLDTLGAGFSLASHDLDIRGAGNLLGEEQSGHIKEVGLELYHQMLEEAVAAARSAEAEDGAPARDGDWSPQIGLGASVLIPEDYVEDLNVRLTLYRRAARLADAPGTEDFAAELIDRFGSLPDEVDHLLKIVAIKQLCRAANVAKVDAGPRGATLSFRNDSFANPAGLVRFLEAQRGTASLRPDHSLVYLRDWQDLDTRLGGVRRLIGDLAALVAEAETRSSAA